jgi:hypothetical protein
MIGENLGPKSDIVDRFIPGEEGILFSYPRIYGIADLKYETDNLDPRLLV